MRFLKHFPIPPLVATILLSVGCPAPIFAQPVDMVPVSQAVVVRAPADVLSWPATVQITGVTIDTSLHLTTAAPIPWQDTPDFSGSGGMGPLQYTVWVCVQNPGWQCAGFVQMWRTRAAENPAALPPLPSGFSFWWGSQSGGAVAGVFGGYVPKPGDTIAVFLAAGDERGGLNAAPVHERSNVVTIQMVAGDAQTVSFSGPPVTPPPPPPPPVIVVPPVDPSTELMDRVASLEDDVVSLKTALDSATNDIAVLGQRLSALSSSMTELGARIIPASCSASVFGVPIHCALGK